nr:flocculation protein FLO11-like [Nicotiana tomentosiformis]
MPSSVIQNQVPFSVLFPHSPLFSLPPRVFESTCFVHNLTLGKDKLAPRALKCVFLGYSKTQKGYRYYSPDLQQCLMFTNVTFFESQPYFTGPGDHLDISEVLPAPSFGDLVTISPSSSSTTPSPTTLTLTPVSSPIAPPTSSTTEVLPIPTIKESSVALPVSPATGTPLLTYRRRSRPASGPADSRPTPDPASTAGLSPHSPPLALRKGWR